MESHGIAGHIQVTAATYRLLQEQYTFQPRGSVEVKGKGQLNTYMLVGRGGI
jgi:adenylate cyclase